MVLLIERYVCEPSISAGSWSVGIPTGGGMKLCPNTGERSERGFGYLWLSKLLWQFGQQKIATTASHEGSAKRTEMTCGLRRAMSRSMFGTSSFKFFLSERIV